MFVPFTRSSLYLRGSFIFLLFFLYFFFYFFVVFFYFFFFFSSRRRHTRLTCDWSSDVCSSDLGDRALPLRRHGGPQTLPPSRHQHLCVADPRRPGRGKRLSRGARQGGQHRSEERRVGKECRSRWSPDHEKKKMSRTYNKDHR